MFEDQREQLAQQLKHTWESIQENSTFLRAKDQFDNLSPSLQKIILTLAFVLITGTIFYVPYSIYDQSILNTQEFEKQRGLIRELLKAHREASEAPQIPLPPSLSEIESQVRQILSNSALKPEQIKSVQVSSASSSLIPGHLSSGGLSINLSLINLEQLITLGFQIENINQSVKMTGLDIQPTPSDKRYFDVNINLVALAVPEVPQQPIEEEPKAKNKKGKVRD